MKVLYAFRNSRFYIYTVMTGLRYQKRSLNSYGFVQAINKIIELKTDRLPLYKCVLLLLFCCYFYYFRTVNAVYYTRPRRDLRKRTVNLGEGRGISETGSYARGVGGSYGLQINAEESRCHHQGRGEYYHRENRNPSCIFIHLLYFIMIYSWSVHYSSYKYTV